MVEVGPDPAAATRRLQEHGVLLSGTLKPGVFRALTHLDIGDPAIDAARSSASRERLAGAGAST